MATDNTTLDLSRAAWRKSAHSGQNGNCVEVAAVWRKSRRSHQNGACVEVAALSQAIAVRDSKNPHGPKLIFARQDWQRFSQRVKGEEFEE